MKIKKEENGTLLVPIVVNDEDFSVDALVEILPDNPEYKKYLLEYEREQEFFKI